MEELQFCRLCLTTSAVYHSLLQNNGKQMLQSLTGIEISDDYPYSTESCVKCWYGLKLAYHIQQSFVEAEKKFQLSGIHGIESKLDIKLPNNEDDISAVEDPSVNVEKFESYFKEENLHDIEHSGDNDITISDDDPHYPELIYIQTEDDSDVVKTSICPICGLSGSDNNFLYSHISNHYNEPQNCSECRTSLPNISIYRTHIESKHPLICDKTYTCGICSSTFKYLSLYELHLTTAHRDTARTGKKKNFIPAEYSSWKCLECNKVFRNKAGFNTHVKGHAKKPCPICGVKITYYNLNKHISLHDAQPVICHLCGITSKNSESLRGHMYYTHSQKRLTCDACGREFKKLYAYKMHIKKEHTGERTFTCDTCGKRFFTQYELNTHIKCTHLKERPHICKFCNKGFSSRFSLKTHERQHTKEAPYICEICGEGFRQNVSLRAHRKSKHNIIECKKAECPICGKMFKDDWALKSHTRSVHD